MSGWARRRSSPSSGWRSAALEAQRDTFGDDVVDAGLRPLQARIAVLESATGEERKLVTTLFADLVGFTTMSEAIRSRRT